MGADIGDQTKAIEKIKEMHEEGKSYISHHIRNGLLSIRKHLMFKDMKGIEREIDHISEDLARAGL